MCAVSAINDYGRTDFWPSKPWERVAPIWPMAPFVSPTDLPPIDLPNKDAEIAALKKKLEEFELLIAAAKRYDEATAQPHCEDPQKAQVMERVLEALQRIEKKLGAQD